MGTRSLRLFLSAYLRGEKHILREKYTHGLRSKLREEFLLWAVGMEQTADLLVDKLRMQATFLAPNIDLQKFKSTVREFVDDVERLHHIKFYDITALRPKKRVGALESAVHLFQALEKTELFDTLLQEHKRLAQ